MLVSDAARRALEPALAAIAARVPIFVCGAADFLGITGHDIHRGCLALVERPPALALDGALAAARLAVVLEGVGNADNVGGVFRNAAAFGADVVLLSPTCCNPLYRKAIRTSMGATLRVPFVQLDEWPAVLTRLRAAGFTLVALIAAAEPSEPLDTFAARHRAPKLALLIGAEGPGLTAAVESAADHRSPHSDCARHRLAQPGRGDRHRARAAHTRHARPGYTRRSDVSDRRRSSPRKTRATRPSSRTIQE